jgi:hypothetical protein
VSLLGHYLAGHGAPVVIDWSYFRRNSSFVNEARRLQIGHLVSGWSAPWNTDMYAALGGFTIGRDTVNCFLVYDHYDFDPRRNWKNLVYFPLWARQVAGAREFVIRASGTL